MTLFRHFGDSHVSSGSVCCGSRLKRTKSISNKSIRSNPCIILKEGLWQRYVGNWRSVAGYRVYSCLSPRFVSSSQKRLRPTFICKREVYKDLNPKHVFVGIQL